MIRTLRGYDEALLLRVYRLRRQGVTRVMRAFTRLGDVSSWIAYGLLLLAVGGEGPGLAALLGAAAGLATLVSLSTKRLCRRARPDCGLHGVDALIENPDAFSFPSGHTAVAVAVGVSLLGHGPPMLGPLAIFFACGVASSRVYLGAHFPLDVAVGSLVGILAGVVTRVLLGVP